MEGVLHKLGGGALTSWQRRFCKITDDQLHYYDADCADESKHKGFVPLRGCSIHDRGAADSDKPCFSIEGPADGKKSGKEYFFYAKDNAAKFRWVTALMQATSNALYSFLQSSAANAAAERDATRARIAKSRAFEVGLLTEATGNVRCADCGADQPTWAVVSPSIGVVVCIECVGVHRGLWAGSCKELQLDSWSDEELALLTEHGNICVNQKLEAMVPLDTPKPHERSSRALREAFIVKKYRRDFVLRPEGGDAYEPPRDKPVDLHHAPTEAAMSSVPPKYIGVVFFVAQRLVGADGPMPSKPFLVLANGYQFVASRKQGEPVSGEQHTLQWLEGMQIGTDNLRRPLTLTVTDGPPDRLHVKATFSLVPAAFAPTEEPAPVIIHGTDDKHRPVTFMGLLSFSGLC